MPGNKVCCLCSLVVHVRSSLPIFCTENFPNGIANEVETDYKSLAYAELYLTIAHLFRRFELELYQTTPEDMDWKDVTVPRMKGQLKVIVRQAKD